MKFSFVNENTEALRLDNLLVNALAAEPDYEYITRSQVKQWILAGRVSVNEQSISKAGFLVKQADTIDIDLPVVEENYLTPYDFSLDIFYEDEDLLVINKPANLTMHPGAGNKDKTLLNAVVAYLDGQMAFIVHRLDKDTTGLVVVAKNEVAKAKLALQFSERTVDRRYQALALVSPRGKREIQNSEAGRIETFIGRHAKHRKLMSVLEDGGRKAITNWTVKEKFHYAYLLELKLETGRTHQIRVHLDHLGSPIVGDLVYGDFSSLPRELKLKADAFGRQALHAYKLSFKHPKTGKILDFHAPLAEDFDALIEQFRVFAA